MVNITAIITTYNRDKYLYKNINILDKQCRSFIYKVLVIDNASNININKYNNDFISIIHNKNLGGSGGYTRGLYEAHKDKECTHVLLMDDDIEFKPSILKSSIDFISKQNNDDWLGFAMMKLDKPNIQFELGAYWNGIRMHNNNKNLDLSNPNDLKKNIPNKKYNYSAWWSLIMPISVIDKYGYPFPFFIKFDDIEYGLRRRDEHIRFNSDFKIWHESFDKKFNPYLEYYLVRNSFITNALHFKHAKWLSLIRYLGKCVKYYFKGRYKAIKMTNLGCKEYFIGPDLFIKNNISEINKRILNISNIPINICKSIIIYPFIALSNSLKIIFKFNKIKKQYLNKYKYLTSEEYWLKQFEIK